MIDIFLLEQFLAFVETGTLSLAAKQLHISQPALSKSMRKLESLTGVPLFTRQKNRLVLNDSGEYFATLVKDVLNRHTSMIDQLKNYDKTHHSIHIGVCAPIIKTEFSIHVPEVYPDYSIHITLDIEENLLEGLHHNIYQLVVLPHDYDDLYCKVCGDEQLYLSLPPAHPLSSYDEVSFEDIDGITMMIMKDIGFWQDIVDKNMKNTKFLPQEDRDAFFDIATASTLPIFTSDYFIHHNNVVNNRVHVPISDDDAYTTYYLCTKKTDKSYYQSLYDHISITMFDPA